jgi:hypothetical protein
LVMDNQSPTQFIWIALSVTGQIDTVGGVSAPSTPNSGAGVLLVKIANNSTGNIMMMTLFGGSSSSNIPMAVSTDGKRVAFMFSTTTGTTATYLPCNLVVPTQTHGFIVVAVFDGTNGTCIASQYFICGSTACVVGSVNAIVIGWNYWVYIGGQATINSAHQTITIPPLAPLGGVSTAGTDSWVAKLDGNYLTGIWANAIASAGNDQVMSIALDGRHGLMVAGYFAANPLCVNPGTNSVCTASSAVGFSDGSFTNAYFLKFDTITGILVCNQTHF